ncbi:hypothetical protein ACI77O_13380 [Pseudomonas tritici]|uniref:hypothetical protein n=1 Tax=Pseudomonas tritici TaxID=2745518 RepID=UPI00387ADC31
MGKGITVAALCIAYIQTPHAGAATFNAALPAQDVVLRVVVDAGTTSMCGFREAPHLIEHLLLSDTAYGATPVDAIITLRRQGIKLSAFTRSDFTEFTLEGPSDKAKAMSEAVVTFLGRTSIPKAGFEQEKRTIISEIRADDTYVSSPTFYERFIAVSAGARPPCEADTHTFLTYGYDAVQSAYTQLYTADALTVIAQAATGTFDLDSISKALTINKGTTQLDTQHGAREDAQSIKPIGWDGIVEVIIPIAGRASLPQDGANALADQLRLEVQADIRRTQQLYSASTFVEQSMTGGWIRLEVPSVDRSKAPELLRIVEAAISRVDLSKFGSDPIWLSKGAMLSTTPTGPPVIADLSEPRVSVVKIALLSIWNWLANL